MQHKEILFIKQHDIFVLSGGLGADSAPNPLLFFKDFGVGSSNDAVQGWVLNAATYPPLPHSPETVFDDIIEQDPGLI